MIKISLFCSLILLLVSVALSQRMRGNFMDVDVKPKRPLQVQDDPGNMRELQVTDITGASRVILIGKNTPDLTIEDNGFRSNGFQGNNNRKFGRFVPSVETVPIQEVRRNNRFQRRLWR